MTKQSWFFHHIVRTRAVVNLRLTERGLRISSSYTAAPQRPFWELKLVMADEVAKRREIRRRKILENSEGRLKKLLGHNAQISPEGEAVERPTTPPKMRAVFVSKHLPHTKNVANDAPSINSETSTESPPDDPSPALSNRHLLRNLNDDFDFSTGDVSARSEVEDIRSKNVNGSELFTQRSSFVPRKESDQKMSRAFEPQSAIYFLRIRRTIIFALSFVVYFLLYFDILQHVIGKSIIIPFILTEVGISTYGHFFMEIPSTKSSGAFPSLLNGALILSGVPDYIVSRILHSYYFLTCLFEELSIFLFSIFVVHWVAQVV